MIYDYLIVGAGLYGAVFARQAADAGKRVLVIDKRPHIAGNVYTEKQHGIHVHVYGAHIFHTNDKRVWDYVNRFAAFNRFTNSPIANYKGEIYSMPFNMYTFNKMWGVVTPAEAKAEIDRQRAEITGEPENLEEQAISLVGRDIFERLVKGYTERQWGRDCRELPPFIIRRLPVRLTYDNNYFNALYQGIPVGGYTKMVERLLDGIEVRLSVDYLKDRAALDALARKVVYTGPIDAFYGCRLGALEYRSVRFETEYLDIPSFQGNAAVNYTDRETPGPASSNTSGSSSERTRPATTSPAPSSAANTAPPGGWATSPITPSTTQKTPPSASATAPSPPRNSKSPSAAAWANTNTTTWTRSSPPPSTRPTRCWDDKSGLLKRPGEKQPGWRQQGCFFAVCSAAWKTLQLSVPTNQGLQG